MAERIEYLDGTKGIAMLLVIAGHCYWLNSIPQAAAFIYSFHMPLFFILSGMFVKPLRLKEVWRKYSKAYLWPYFVTCLLLLLVGCLVSLVKDEDVWGTVQNQVARIYWGSGIANGKEKFATLPSVGPIWFLLGLFWATSVYACLKRNAGKIERMLWVSLLAIIAVETIRFVRLPLSLQAGMFAVLYLAIGNWARNVNLIERLDDVGWVVKVLCFVLFVVIVMWYRVGWFNMSNVSLGWNIVGVWCSVVGSFAVMYVCYKTKIKMGWIGRNTLYILCAHTIVLMGVGRLVDVKNWEWNGYLNLVVELAFEIVGSLVIAWVLKKIKVLNFNALFKRDTE